jgi:HEAT repeat protein
VPFSARRRAVLARELEATDNWFYVDQMTGALGDLGPAGAPAVPALVAKLEAADWASSRCAFALARIGEPALKALPAIAAAMEKDHERSAIYAFAFWMLGGDRKRALAKIEAANDAYWSLTFAVRALDHLGDEAVHALPLLVRWLPSYPRDDFVRILSRLGPKAEPALPGILALMDSPWQENRRAAARVLGAIGSEAAVPALVKALADRRPEVRIVAARALAKLRAEAAVPTLVRLLHDPGLAPEAMDALVTIGRPSVEPILAMPPDTRKAVRERALETLIRIERRHGCVVPVLLVAPHGGPGQRIAEESLVKMGEAAVPGLTRAAKGRNRSVANRAKRILERIDSRRK